MKPTESIVASVQHTTAVLFSPYEPGIATETLKPRNAVLWQLGGGALCVALLSARASWFEASNHKFSGSGTGLLVGLVLAGQLLAYFAYIFLAAAAAYLFVKRATSYRGTLGVVSYSTFPLLLGWAF